MRTLTTLHIRQLIQSVGILPFFQELIAALREDYAAWPNFIKYARHATHYEDGVIELMPISGPDFYAFKYVNGHPNNPKQNKQTVVALGVLAAVENGYPQLISEMTLLTALRTAATSALASEYLAKKESKIFGIIGTGAQAEFQVLAHVAHLGIEEVRYFDIDPLAMEKFAHNLAPFSLNLIPTKSAEETLKSCDIITTATADKSRAIILKESWIPKGLHINGIGGDCPGKTELEASLLNHCKIVVEYLEQSKQEGEIQYYQGEIYAHLWELAAGKKIGRENATEITLFDSVGFALEDYSILKYVHALANRLDIGDQLPMIPTLKDPKNLFGFLSDPIIA